MYIRVGRIGCWLSFILFLSQVQAYGVSGINAAYNFGTIAPPFPDLVQTDNDICVGYTVLLESPNYFVRATSSSSASTAFQMTNTTSSAYKLNYSVAWSGSAASPTYVTLASGQNSSTTFPARLLSLGCVLLANFASLRLQLLSADQVLAKQGNYTDTLTILIVSST